jgi:hypothetical protein
MKHETLTQVKKSKALNVSMNASEKLKFLSVKASTQVSKGKTLAF